MSTLVLFEQKRVRRVWHADAWWFAVVDVVAALTDSANPTGYLHNIRRRDDGLNAAFKGESQITPPLSLRTETGGGMQKVLCWHTAGLLRLIQSIPSPKAEPFKRWLAQVGYERIQEIADPELAAKRMREIYRQKGYSEAWIEKRLRGIAVRDELTAEWQQRGVREERDFAILTAEISKATFGLTPSQYRQFKALSEPTDNLRDHMTDLELIFTMLGEASTTEIARQIDAQGFPENKTAAKDGGEIAGNARRALEVKSGRKVSTSKNFKQLRTPRRPTED